jgi:hypothetical protein
VKLTRGSTPWFRSAGYVARTRRLATFPRCGKDKLFRKECVAFLYSPRTSMMVIGASKGWAAAKQMEVRGTELYGLRFRCRRPAGCVALNAQGCLPKQRGKETGPKPGDRFPP